MMKKNKDSGWEKGEEEDKQGGGRGEQYRARRKRGGINAV